MASWTEVVIVCLIEASESSCCLLGFPISLSLLSHLSHSLETFLLDFLFRSRTHRTIFLSNPLLYLQKNTADYILDQLTHKQQFSLNKMAAITKLINLSRASVLIRNGRFYSSAGKRNSEKRKQNLIALSFIFGLWTVFRRHTIRID